ncbi:diguanylate cyclase domain-containing protein [Lysobacter sp. A3-1-A15]|uniref:diguanylate cyclase domain-containing protein n=1 Tax=Novilysobacter viscosus TaxID=3098602 RepID=UPI002ED87686
MSLVRTLCLLASLATLLVWSPPVAALQPDKTFHHYVRSTWSIEEGLPQISAVAIAQGGRGYIWVGTQAGLARFDGVKFQAFTPENEPELPGIWIRSLHSGRDGRIWIGSYKGLAVHDGRDFRAVPAADATQWPQLDINAVAEDATGTIWVATNAGVFEVRDHVLHPLAGSPAPALSLAWSEGRWAVGGHGAVYFPADGQWRRERLPAAASDAPVNRLAHAHGRLWAATAVGLFVDRDGTFGSPVGDPTPDNAAAHAVAGFQEASVPQLNGVPVDLLLADSDGNLWAGGDAGLARIRADGPTEFVPASGPGGVAGVRTGLEDREGNLWLGSQWEGLIRLRDGWTRRYGTAEGLPGPIVWSVAADPDGSRIWVGQNDGVSVLEDGRFLPVASGEALPHPQGYNLLAERDRLWIGTRRGVAFIDHGGPAAGQVRQPDWAGTVAELQINGLVRDREGHLWIATSDGLFEHDGTALKRWGEEDGLEDPRVRFVYVDGPRALLVGSQSGVFEFDGTRFTRKSGLTDGLDITAIKRMADGRLVVGALSEAVYFEHEGHWQRLSAEEGMPANSPFALMEHAGYLWVAGIRGIVRVPVEDLAALAERRIPRVRGQMLLNERGDPMSGQQGYCCNGAGTSKGFLRGDTLWLPTRDGVVAFDTQAIRPNTVPPSVEIERVMADGDWWPAHLLANAELPVTARDITFEFTVLSFQDPRSNTVEYRLEGYDRDWQTAPLANRSARYTNLPPGDYVFEVRGLNNTGTASQAPARLSFSIEPKVYETRAFAIAVALLALALLGLGVHHLQGRHRRQRRALEEVVQQRTEALAAANERLREASQTDPLTGLRNRRYMASQIPADLAYYDRQIRQGPDQGKVMVFALVDIDHFKAVNDTHGHRAGDLVLQQFAGILRALVRSGDYVVRWGGEEFLLVFRPMPASHVPQLGERLRAAVAEHTFDLGNGQSQQLTCSVGLAEYPLFVGRRGVGSWETLVEMADQALYFVKTRGRDGWAAFRPTDTTPEEDLLQALQAGPEVLLAEGRLALVGSPAVVGNAATPTPAEG